MKRAAWGLLSLLACGGGPEHEQLGDAAWHGGRYAEAAAYYDSAGSSSRLLAKRADAALLAGRRDEAILAWVELGRRDAAHTGDAAAGLARAAVAAEAAEDQGALARAVAGLRELAPGWPVGRLALRLRDVGVLPPEVAVAVIPAALALAPRGAADSLILVLGHAEASLGGCIRAVPLFEGVVRRSDQGERRDTATRVLASCELTLGLAALTEDRPGEADRWLDRAATRDPLSAVGRRALVGVGDARFRMGDLFAASLAWQAVATAPVAPDSITLLALERLRGPETAPLDSAVSGRP